MNELNMSIRQLCNAFSGKDHTILLASSYGDGKEKTTLSNTLRGNNGILALPVEKISINDITSITAYVELPPSVIQAMDAENCRKKTISAERILEEIRLYDKDFVTTSEIEATLRKVLMDTGPYPGYLTDIIEQVFGNRYDESDIYEICKNICQ